MTNSDNESQRLLLHVYGSKYINWGYISYTFQRIEVNTRDTDRMGRVVNCSTINRVIKG